MATVNYYVDTVSGDSGNGGSSTGDAWDSIATALADSGLQSNSGNDIIINCTGTLATKDSNITTLSNSITCDSLTVTADGADADGWASDKYTLSGTNGDTLRISNIAANVVLKEMQIELISSDNGNDSAIRTASINTGSTQRAENVRILINNTSTSGTQRGVACLHSQTDMDLVNVIVDKTGAGTSTVKGVDRTSGAINAYNTTVNNMDNGFDGIVTAKNCVAANCTESFDSSNVTATTCAGDQSGVTGVTQVTDWTTELEDTSTGDFTIKTGSTILKDGGADVSAENGGVSTDIDGNTRSGTWDIGAAEDTAPSITLSSPDTIIASEATQLVGTLLNTVTNVELETTDEATTVTQSITSQDSTTLDFTADAVWSDVVPGTPQAGLPINATVYATGATVYALRVSVDDGVTTATRNVTFNLPNTHQAVQTMIAQANTTAGESLFDAAIIAVEDNMIAVLPKQVDGVNITVNGSGELVMDGNQTLEFDVQYWSPANEQWSEVTHTWLAVNADLPAARMHMDGLEFQDFNVPEAKQNIVGLAPQTDSFKVPEAKMKVVGIVPIGFFPISDLDLSRIRFKG